LEQVVLNMVRRRDSLEGDEKVVLKSWKTILDATQYILSAALGEIRYTTFN